MKESLGRQQLELALPWVSYHRNLIFQTLIKMFAKGPRRQSLFLISQGTRYFNYTKCAKSQDT